MFQNAKQKVTNFAFIESIEVTVLLSQVTVNHLCLILAVVVH